MSARIAILSAALAGGGAERITLTLASSLARRGHKVDLVLKSPVCEYPVEALPGLRLLYLMEPDAAEADMVYRALPVVSDLLCPRPYPFSVRFPRISLAPALSLGQLPLLSSRNSPQWSAAIAAYLDRERPVVLLARQLPSVVAATVARRAARHRLKIVGTMNNSIKSSPRGHLRRARRSYPLLARILHEAGGL